ncbi:MAG: RHS repeat protein, partial [Acidobacteria bacterium]|nr:RHS repeat protein [Acidobacteriota bacterium]
SSFMKKLCFTTGPLLAVLVFIGTVMPLRADNPAVPCVCKSIFNTDGATLCNVTFANNSSPTPDQLATVSKVRAKELDGSPGPALELKKQDNGQYKIQLHMDYIQATNCSETSGAELHWKVEYTDQSAARTGIFPVLNPSNGIYELELDGKDSYSSFSVSYVYPRNGIYVTTPCVSFKFKSSCACSSCDITGQPVSSNSAERCHIPLGVFQDATLSGGLVIDIPSLANSSASRSVVKVLSSAGITVTADSGGLLTATTDSLRAVVAEQGTNKIKISLFDPADQSQTNAIRTIVVEWPGQNELKITNTFAGSPSTPEVTEFKITNDGLEMIRGNGMLKETKTITTVNGDRVERINVKETHNGITESVSDIENTYHYFIWGWELVKQVIDPGTEGLTTTWTYATAQGAAQGSLQEMSRYDGYIATHSYSHSTEGTVVTTIHTIVSPFAISTQQRVSTRVVDSADASQSLTEIVSSNANIISKIVTEDVPNTRTEKTYSDGTHFTTTETLYNATNGRPEQVTHPDETLTTYIYESSNGNLTTTIANGEAQNGVVIDGTKRITTTNAKGVETESITSRFNSDHTVITEHTKVSDFDTYGRPEEVEYFPDPDPMIGPAWTTSKTYQGCCGNAELTETDKYGIVTTYGEPDALGRRTWSTRLGVTTSTEYVEYDPPTAYEGFVTITKRNGLIIAKSFRNLAGTYHESWSPDPSSHFDEKLVSTSTETTYDNGLTLTETTVPDGSQVTSSYPDGRIYTTTGDLQPAMTHTYSVNGTGLVTTSAYAGGNESTTVTADWAGRTYTTTQDSATTTQTYNTLGQLLSTTDADGVQTLYAYNSLGERTTTALDVDNDGEIDYDDADQITITETVPDTYNDGNTTYDVMTTTTMVYTAFGDDDTTATVSTTYQTPDGLHSWSTSDAVASPSKHVIDRTTWKQTSTNPDGSYSETTINADGLTDATKHYSADITPVLIAQVNYTYDTLKRPSTTTDSRTTTTTTTYVSNTCDIVESVIEENGNNDRTTTYSYDSRGRRVSTTLPDASVTYSSYYPDGQLKATWGSQTYPTFTTYDYAGRRKTLRTNPTLDNGIPTNAGDSLTTWNYSSATGRLTSKVDAANKSVAYTYTDAGRLETQTWARGVSATYTYTSGRLT